MKFTSLLALTILTLLASACQPSTRQITILADGEIHQLRTASTLPAEILAQASLDLGDSDRLMFLGLPISLDSPLPPGQPATLIVRRAITLTLHQPSAEAILLLTSAQTIGMALDENGYTIGIADRLDPPAETPLSADTQVTWIPATNLTITVDGTQVMLRSSAPSIGQALAEAGLPLIGLDYSLPPENDPLPSDGQIRLVRVIENIALTQKAIPYNTRSELTADLEIDQRQLIQAGEPGLAITRLRTRTEDSQQVSQVTETESTVRAPQDEVFGLGTDIVIRTTTVDGVTFEYWRALNLYATYYVPCDPVTNICHYGTSSGTRVHKGSVAMVYPWYLLFAGEHLYIPGYGYGVVEDNNGAMTNFFGDTYWVDLGYAETDVADWTNRYVTVYFLTPVPANLADTYLLP